MRRTKIAQLIWCNDSKSHDATEQAICHKQFDQSQTSAFASEDKVYTLDSL
ncbi:hypothetical protein MKI79_03660 [Acinetobacter sp. A3.8]|uniref:Uncharacterized protein n=1 Tax=Acinetobacter sedimenti TaxID=2919922 RepID=A0A9X1WVL7_9GAMM|nr:hypothetical protein [Acinetobacter sedimenti]MCJ8146014.1 hypothetical protein [Acinetobacter sedimenti]